MSKENLWWKTGIIYQIYPRSYQDSNGDGVGDLPGIIQRLDYIKSLNVKAIWLSPIYPSPMHDFGYDVANYVDIHPMFGTLADFDRLLAEAHQRDLNVILDLVPNHTSDEHPWFIESRASRDNPKRNWYIWRDPAPDGGPPNNWLSYFGGPAWTYDPKTEQYYLHQFVTQQPELNYRNPEVMPAMQDNMRFWLDKGVDGFRVDVINLMMKDEQFRDEPLNLEWDGVNPFYRLNHIYTTNVSGVHNLIRDFRQVLDEYDERMMVGETYLPIPDLVTYYGIDNGCHLPFNFHLISTEWKPEAIQQLVENYEEMLPEYGWPNWVLGNHDQHRLATRLGPEHARIANILLLTLRGTPTCYYGDELGMENVPIPPDKVQDPPAVNQPEIAHIVGRDPERTPMQWDDSPNAGFSDAGVETWLPVDPDFATCNVTIQSEDPTSFLSFFKALTQLRQSEPALYQGAYRSVKVTESDILAYMRTSSTDNNFLILLNFGPKAVTLDVSHVASKAEIVLSSNMNGAGQVDLHTLLLDAHEGLVLRV